jgi:hypothetical protein
MENPEKCFYSVCTKPATLCLRLNMKTADEKFTGVGFINLHVCDEHKLTDDEVQVMFEAKWPHFSLAFGRMNMPIPDIKKSSHSWVPIEEEVEFYKELPPDMKTEQLN